MLELNIYLLHLQLYYMKNNKSMSEELDEYLDSLIDDSKRIQDEI